MLLLAYPISSLLTLLTIANLISRSRFLDYAIEHGKMCYKLPPDWYS